MANGIQGGGGSRKLPNYDQLIKQGVEFDRQQRLKNPEPKAEGEGEGSGINLPELGGENPDAGREGKIIGQHLERAGERLAAEIPGLDPEQQTEVGKDIMQDAVKDSLEDIYLKPRLKRWEEQLKPTKKALEDWRDANPTKAKVATAGVVFAAGALAGSDGIEKAGVPLSKKFSFADDKLRASLGAEFDAGYRNLGATARLSGQHAWSNSSGNHSLSGSLEASSRNGSEAVLGYSYSSLGGRSTASAYVKADDHGRVASELSYSREVHKDGQLKLSASTGRDIDDSVNLTYVWQFK